MSSFFVDLFLNYKNLKELSEILVPVKFKL